MEIISIVIRMIPIAIAWILSFVMLKTLINISAKRNKKKILYMSDYLSEHNKSGENTTGNIRKEAV